MLNSCCHSLTSLIFLWILSSRWEARLLAILASSTSYSRWLLSTLTLRLRATFTKALSSFTAAETHTTVAKGVWFRSRGINVQRGTYLLAYRCAWKRELWNRRALSAVKWVCSRGSHHRWQSSDTGPLAPIRTHRSVNEISSSTGRTWWGDTRHCPEEDGETKEMEKYL